MADWSDGYVTNTEYTSHFYPFLSPSSQNFALLLSGIMPVDLNAGYTYCELGCGQGYTTAVLAASNPNGRFWGVDFNPAQLFLRNQSMLSVNSTSRAQLEQTLVLIARGDIRPVIAGVEPLEAIASVHARLEAGGVAGRIVVRPGESMNGTGTPTRSVNQSANQSVNKAVA